MKTLFKMFLPALLAALGAADADAERITGARYADPVQRYGHYALGKPHEYARVVATTNAGRELVFELPENEVFEDLAPRIVQLAAGQPEELLAIVSRRGSGARLMLIRLNDGRLEAGAQSPAIGTPMRWLNPVGVADLDGDGQAEIAAVITPHIGGTLRIYRRQDGQLVEVGALGGFSNHVYGSAELALSAPLLIAGRMRLLVPDTARLTLRVVGFDNGRLVEIGRCPLPSPVVGAMSPTAPAGLAVGLTSGKRFVFPDDCPR